ncbi:hypothetical protein [Falsiroseomonas sp. HW251]|uniref:hypothetical protein n=1 Tax=Falsiroseomonas sp. HW251 TaxID=3390998 RepID=UPI003D320292
MLEDPGRTPDELRAFARRCRTLAAGVGSSQDRQHLLDLAVTLESEARSVEAVQGGPLPAGAYSSQNTD